MYKSINHLKLIIIYYKKQYSMFETEDKYYFAYINIFINKGSNKNYN